MAPRLSCPLLSRNGEHGTAIRSDHWLWKLIVSVARGQVWANRSLGRVDYLVDSPQSLSVFWSFPGVCETRQRTREHVGHPRSELPWCRDTSLRTEACSNGLLECGGLEVSASETNRLRPSPYGARVRGDNSFRYRVHDNGALLSTHRSSRSPFVFAPTSDCSRVPHRRSAMEPVIIRLVSVGASPSPTYLAKLDSSLTSRQAM